MGFRLAVNIKFEKYSFHSNVCTLVCCAMFTQPVDCCTFNRGILRVHSSGIIEVYKIFRKDLFDDNCWQPFNVLSFNLVGSELQYSRLYYRCLRKSLLYAKYSFCVGKFIHEMNPFDIIHSVA